jgi:hypothetical protein
VVARELGLEVAARDPVGWSVTNVPEPTARAYAGRLEELAAALVLWRRLEQRTATAGGSRNLLACTCGCGRRIRVAPSTLADAPILCGACDEPFQPQDVDT